MAVWNGIPAPPAIPSAPSSRSTCQILPPAPDGSRSVAIGETERIYGTQWTVVVTLRPGRTFLEERIRIENPTALVRPYYFWNCTAVPNPPGFRFIYPMTLGSDHSGKNFYTWPIADGKDLSRGSSYEDASSIFAYQCDQDFFGSYDEDSGHGVVAFANHHLLSGKKAWTWGHGSYGTMHQMDLTDNDGPYNEVQTGPLPTQADVGRLDPGEAVEWQEWWYPIHDIGPFTFATREVAATATWTNDNLRLRLLGTGNWRDAHVQVAKGQDTRVLASADCTISPEKPATLELPVRQDSQPVTITVTAGPHQLAQFDFPLPLPVRTPPTAAPEPSSASEWAQAGWQEYLFAHYPGALKDFNKALASDKRCLAALTGLAFLKLDSDPAAAAASAREALAADPEHGLARFALASAERRLEHFDSALDEAWKATLDPATAVPARALVGELLIRKNDWSAAVQALSADGPWQSDPQVRNRLAFALLQRRQIEPAVHAAHDNLQINPLDAFARSLLWLAHAPDRDWSVATLLQDNPQNLLELITAYSNLGQPQIALDLIETFDTAPPPDRNPIVAYWAGFLAHQLKNADAADRHLEAARRLSPIGVFPHRVETIAPLRWALSRDPHDGQAALYLGHLLFSLGRHDEGRSYWQQAAENGTAPAIAYRALGMAKEELDNDLRGAANLLEKAHQADPADPIVARDLARAWFALADKETSQETRKHLQEQARDVLQKAFDAGQGRADFVALLARALSRLGDYKETARLLDSVRITIWEGAREAHDLFEQAHLTLGQKELEAGHPEAALAQFNRALEYPKNLATGRLENTCDSQIHYLRGLALERLGREPDALEAWRLATEQPHSSDRAKEAARDKARAELRKRNGSPP